MPGGETIIRQKLSDQVFDRLWEMIVSGELSPGDHMPSERQLMERFGVGRPAVREAMQSLANKGLITISHGERSKVNALSASLALDQVDDIAKLLLSSEPQNLSNLKEVRKILEAGTIRIAARNCTKEDSNRLYELVERQRENIGEDKAFVQSDINFHLGIAAITKNRLLEVITEAMLRWLFEYYKPVLHWRGREETTLAEHKHLADLISAHDEEGAIKLMRQHLNRSDPLYVNIN